MTDQKISPFLWFDNKAEEAANFYTSVFKNSRIIAESRYGEHGPGPAGSIMTIEFELEGQKFTAINGGPHFKINHSISFFVYCETEAEIDDYWHKLSEDNKQVFWPLQQYPWSEKYGWITDKYGVSWQLILSKTLPKISPLLMFDGNQWGKAQDAMDFYISVFNNAQIDMVEHYGPENKACEGKIVHALFSIEGQKFLAMDSGMPSDINFNEAISFVINCDTQDEIDHFWEKLSSGGGHEAQCGWLKDQFGVSWQIVPSILPKLVGEPDAETSNRVMTALLKMKKLDIKTLVQAYENN